MNICILATWVYYKTVVSHMSQIMFQTTYDNYGGERMAIESISGSNLTGIKFSDKNNQAAPITVATNQHIKVEAVDTNKGYSEQQGNSNNSECNNELFGKEVSPDKVNKAVADINNKIKTSGTVCSFHYHEDTNRISITVKDKESQEVIREIPPEKTLDMIAKVWELAGILVDEKR